MKKRLLLVIFFYIFTLCRLSLAGNIYEIYPSNADVSCSEEFENIANALQAGDELILHGGNYSQSCVRKITGIVGTSSQPIIIRAADGEIPILTRPVPPSYNYGSIENIEFENSSYIIIKGLHFRGGRGGVEFINGNHITLEDSEIYETGNNGIRMNSYDTDSFIIRRNHIHHTGLRSDTSTEGEGMYIGCHSGSCVAKNHIIDNNYIHTLRATSQGGNDGIEIKYRSYNITIKNNVIHNTDIGTLYPCIFLYGGGNGINIAEGNVMWNCGEGIQVVSDALIQNNIIANSTGDVGINAAPHVVVPFVRNVTIIHNTIYNNNPNCIYIRWSSANNMVLANNAIYCPIGNAINAQGLSNPSILVKSNYVEGNMIGASIDNNRFFSGGSAQATFLDAQFMNFWLYPNSSLIGNANTSLSTIFDFNEIMRGAAPHDIGAYETNSQPSNPWWVISPGFKLINRTNDNQAPIITLINSSADYFSAVITWHTDELSDSQVEYGTTTAYGQSTTLNPIFLNSHSQTLYNLNSNTIYHYIVKSRDPAGNLAVSSDYTFKTTKQGGSGGGSPIYRKVKQTSLSPRQSNLIYFILFGLFIFILLILYKKNKEKKVKKKRKKI